MSTKSRIKFGFSGQPTGIAAGSAGVRPRPIADRQSLLERSGKVFGWIQEGWLHLRIGHRYPLADTAQAYRDLESRKTTGKILITVAPE